MPSSEHESHVRETLRKFVRSEVLQQPDYPLRDDEPLITGGVLDSFSLAHLAVFVEDELGVRLPDTAFTVEDMDTLDQMVRRILKG